MSPEKLVIRPLEPADARAVVALLGSQPDDYLRFFYALAGDEDTISEMLSSCTRDNYSGIFRRDALICTFFVRGWDSGFDVPTFGLVVDVAYRGHHVVSLAVEASKLIARLAGANRMMIKVHPENVAGTIAAARLGFVQDHDEPNTGNIVSYMEL